MPSRPPGERVLTAAPARRVPFESARARALGAPDVHPLRVRRLAARLTASQLADAAGYSQSFVYKVETGRRPMTAAAARRLAEALDCDPGDLTG